MQALKILTAVALALSATLAVVLGVVTLMMGMHLDLRPGLREEWPLLLTFTGRFTGLSLVSGWAFFSLFRGWRGWWIAQALMWVAIVFTSLLSRGLLLA
jgi:hypothetical protein